MIWEQEVSPKGPLDSCDRPVYLLKWVLASPGCIGYLLKVRYVGIK